MASKKKTHAASGLVGAAAGAAIAVAAMSASAKPVEALWQLPPIIVNFDPQDLSSLPKAIEAKQKGCEWQDLAATRYTDRGEAHVACRVWSADGGGLPVGASKIEPR